MCHLVRTLLFCVALAAEGAAFAPRIHTPSKPTNFVKLAAESKSDDNDAKFGFGARIESIKCVVVGAFSGGIALAPASLINDCAISGRSVAQWEFDTDMGALESALFAIVYRYCIREDTNPQLKDGVVGAFLLTRTLTRVQIPSYCSSVPLDCK
jgi:hypothetical protein